MVALVLAMALLAAACGDSDEESTGTPSGEGPAELRVAYVPATTALPVHVAKAQGYFEAKNLDVTLTEAANISDLPATLGRQFDLAMGTATDLIRAGAAGIDVVQVAGNTVSTKDNPFVQVIVPPDKGIDDVADLAGKTIGTPTLSGVIHAGVLYQAKEQGVDPAQIKAVEAPSPNLPDQLKAGRVDAVEALEPFASQLKKDGNVSIGDPFSAIADPLATNFWVADGSWARTNRDVTERFVEAMNQAKDFIAQNGSEARRVLQGYTGMPEPVAATVPLPTYEFQVRTGDLDKWVDVLKEIGQFDGKVDTDNLVVSSS
ncbi:MAG TPA: ABC transporter substrate-binding protein [Acidimicrobiales bacterium]|nr:ABC transporter substrate-binding protein [Acidimicrobiales bacterium]